MVYSNTALYIVESEYGKSGYLYFFFEALDDAFEVHIFQGFILHRIKATNSIGPCSSDCFKSRAIVKQCL